MAAELGLLPKDAAAGFYHRHPLAFLVEAADDICYRIIDFEDGLKLGLIDHEARPSLLRELRATATPRMPAPKARGSGGFSGAPGRRSWATCAPPSSASLVDETATRFAQHAPAILAGTYDAPLVEGAARLRAPARNSAPEHRASLPLAPGAGNRGGRLRGAGRAARCVSAPPSLT
ncbi:MAG: hypothetical protein WKG07_05480 [Hymenobacter sp.]